MATGRKSSKQYSNHRVLDAIACAEIKCFNPEELIVAAMNIFITAITLRDEGAGDIPVSGEGDLEMFIEVREKFETYLLT